MPLIDPPQDPSWAEIEAGITANEAERLLVDSMITGAKNDIRIAEQAVRAGERDLRGIDNNLRKWLRAVRKKAGEQV